jgi:hypothetical protein
MQDTIRISGRSTIPVMTRVIGLMLLLLAFSPGEGSTEIRLPESPTLQQVAYDDGSSWKDMELMTGSVDGPGGGTTPVARFKADLGGPKTYFLLANSVSELAISIARPRFRFTAEEGMARRVRLAQFEVLELARRTPVQVGNGPTVFHRVSELEVSKVSEGVWEVRPKKSLQPGEYALVLDQLAPVADFSIVERGY